MSHPCYGVCAAFALALMAAGSSRIDHGPAFRGQPLAHLAMAATPRALPNFGELPLRFEPNVGQAAPPIEYLARGDGYAVAITEQGALMTLRPGIRPHPAAARAQSVALRQNARLRLRLLHVAPNPRLRAERPLDSVSNYLIGNDPSAWHRNVANYAAVRFQQIYPGIDWVIHGNHQQLEYDFVVAPHADPRHIELRIDGASAMSVDHDGSLLIRVAGRTVRQLQPVIYQTRDDGTRQPVRGRYLLDHGDFTVALGDYDRSRTLIIDPTIVYSTYFGGSGLDQSAAIAADSAGNAYVVGSTWSTDFPTQQPLQSGNSEHSFPTAFIAKFNAAGNALVYSTYLGGTGGDRDGNLGSCGPAGSGNFGSGSASEVNGGDGATAIALDASGNAYVAGYTSSSDFPTVGPLQAVNQAAVNHGSNAFVAELDAAGSALVYSTYLGGSGTAGASITGDSATAIAVDTTGAAYVSGITTSPDFPTQMPFQASNREAANRPTGFVAKLNAAGSALVYSSYLGGSGGNSVGALGDCANAIAVDGGGNAYVAGQTSSTDFPTVAAFQSANRSAAGTGFLAKVSGSGDALAYSTYLGGSAGDAALAVAVDASGAAYLSGYTSSTDFPTASPLQAQNATGGRATNAFVTKFNPGGTALLYSTYLGGSTDDQANALAVDGLGNAYVAGYTYSSDFPLVAATQIANNAAGNGADNAFVSVLNPSGAALTFSTYLGGSGRETLVSCPAGSTSCPTPFSGDGAVAIAVDGADNLYVTGFTSSTDFPTVAPLQSTATSLFVAKVSLLQPANPGTGIVVADPPPAHSGGGALDWEVLGLLAFCVVVGRLESTSRITHERIHSR